MTITEHTPEPWQLGTNISRLIYAENGDTIAECDGSVDSLPVKRDALNAARIVQCVNACVGMDDPVQQIAADRSRSAGVPALCAEIVRLRAQWVEMLAALKQALPTVDAYRRGSGGDGDITAALIRDILAKAQP